MLKRNKGKEISSGNNKLLSEQISYLKVGDHATNMPSAIWYGDKTNGSFAVKTGIIRFAGGVAGSIFNNF